MTRWALIQNGVVANVVEAGAKPPGSWVEVTGAFGPGDFYDGQTFTHHPGGVPQSVTMRQARLALHAAGLLGNVQAAIDAMSEPAKTQAQITWDHSTEVQRRNGLVSQLAPALGLSEQAVDSLFIQASTL